MFIDDPRTRAVLGQIACRLTADLHLREDLAQEGLIHLWQRERQSPGQSAQWYFQSCRYHLQNYLRTGRSVDSLKHRHALEADEAACEQADGGDSVSALVCAREIERLLAAWLTPLEQKILHGLAAGFGVRELALRLGLSHTSVLKRRRQIAAVALKLGIRPVARSL